MRTSKEYVEKLYGMRKNVYMDGKLEGRDEPRLAQAISVMSRSFEGGFSLDVYSGLGHCKKLKYGLHYKRDIQFGK